MAENASGSALVILDASRPLVGRDRLTVELAPQDTVITADGQASAKWLSGVVGHRVDSVRGKDSATRQALLEDAARRLSQAVRVKWRGTLLGPCTEYILLLWLVATSRDVDLLRGVQRLSRDTSFSRLVLHTDRPSHDGLVRALESVSGSRVEVTRGVPDRYLDRVLREYPELPSSPSADEFRRQPRFERLSRPTILATPGLVSVLEGAGMNAGAMDPISVAEGFGDYQPKALARLGRRRFRRVSGRIARAVRRSQPRIVRETARTLGADALLDPLSLAATDHLPSCLRRSLWSAACAVEAHESVLRDPKCVALLVWNDVLPVHRALVDLAKSRGVPTVMLQHGVVGIRTMHDRPRTDWIAAWGPTSKRWWIDCGYPAERIVEVGAAMLALSGHPAEPPAGAPRVLYASQPYVGFRTDEDLATSQRTLVSVDSACRAAGCQLVAKPHPLERVDGWGDELGADAEIHLDTPMPQLTRSVSVIVTRNSTSVLDALDAGVPPVLVESQEFKDMNPFRDILEVDPDWNEATLAEALRQAVTSPPSRDRLRSMLDQQALPGDAAARLVALMLEVAR